LRGRCAPSSAETAGHEFTVEALDARASELLQLDRAELLRDVQSDDPLVGDVRERTRIGKLEAELRGREVDRERKRLEGELAKLPAA
jgi:hypothetical protein